jgi:hypothetical protein
VNSLDCTILRVDKDYRIFLPQVLLRRIGWLTEAQSRQAWLLVGSPGRCRLLSAAEVESDPNLRSLRASIDTELNAASVNVLEFRDEGLVTLALRLLSVEISPPGPGWRLTLPKPLAAIMQIHPKQSDVALLLFGEHIEIWTMETLRSSVATPLLEII